MIDQEFAIQRALGTLPQLYSIHARTENLDTGQVFEDHFDIYAMDHDDAQVKLDATINAKHPEFAGRIHSNLVIDEQRLCDTRMALKRRQEKELSV